MTEAEDREHELRAATWELVDLVRQDEPSQWAYHVSTFVASLTAQLTEDELADMLTNLMERFRHRRDYGSWLRRGQKIDVV